MSFIVTPKRFGHGSVDAELQLRAFGVEGGHDAAQPGLFFRRQKNLLRRFLESARDPHPSDPPPSFESHPLVPAPVWAVGSAPRTAPCG